MHRIPMGRSSTSPDHRHLPVVDNANTNSASLAFHSIRDRFLVKRNPNSLPLPHTSTTAKSSSSASSSSHRPWRGGGAAGGTRSHHHGGGRSAARKLLMFPFRGCGRSMFYLCIFVAVCAFALASMVLQSSVASMMYRQVTGSSSSSSSSERRREVREDLKFGSSLKFVPGRMMPHGEFEHDWLRSQSRIGIRSPRLGLGAENQNTAGAGSAVQKTEDVVSSMLAKAFILGKDAVNKAKSFDVKMRLTSTATATVASLDQKIGLSEKINMGTTIMNDKVKEMDQKFQVSEKTKSAIAAAEQTVSSAGSAIMKNRYMLTGTSWVTGAFNKVTKAAEEVGQKTKEKMTEEERGRNVAQGYAQVHDPDSNSEQPSAKPGPVQGLIMLRFWSIWMILFFF